MAWAAISPKRRCDSFDPGRGKKLIRNHQEKMLKSGGYGDNVRQEKPMSHCRTSALAETWRSGERQATERKRISEKKKNHHFHPSSSTHHLFSAPLTPHSTTAPAPTTSTPPFPPPGVPKPFPATYILSPEGSKHIPAKSRSS